MRVLFVYSGNTNQPFIKDQGESLAKAGVLLDTFRVNGKGLWSYICNVPRLKTYINVNSIDVIHAHYSLSGIVASLATRQPVVCSLMGSDVKIDGFWRQILKIFVKWAWSRTIVKSEDMKQCLKLNRVDVIPNGVNLDLFKPMNKKNCRDKLGWDQHNNVVLFAADPTRTVKNYQLAVSAVDELDAQDVTIKVANKLEHNDMVLYYNAADALLLTSLWEGSPNVVKEAMACNCPVISTNVGDVSWLLDNVTNCFVCQSDKQHLSIAIASVINNSRKSNGREKIMQLGLSNDSIAGRIIGVYNDIVNSEGF